MNRLYVVESTLTITGGSRRPPPGAAAQRRSRRSPARWPRSSGRRRGSRCRRQTARGRLGRWLDRRRQGPAGRIAGKRPRRCAGDGQPPASTRWSHAINHALGNVGKTVVYTEPVEAEPVDHGASLRELVDDMDARRGRDRCVILGGNPVYTAPADLELRRSAGRRCRCASISACIDDETAVLCHWHIPEAHYLEAWGDAARLRRHGLDRPAADRAALRRPVGARAAGRAVSESPNDGGLRDRPRLLARLLAAADRAGSGDFETFWQTALHDGVIAGHAHADADVSTARCDDWRAHRGQRGRSRRRAGTARSSSGPIRRSSTAGSPTTAGCRSCRSRSRKLTWDNAVLISPATAQALGVARRLGDARRRARRRDRRRGRARLSAAARSRRRSGSCPAMPTTPSRVHLGYGRTRAGRVGDRDVGFNAYALRTVDAAVVRHAASTLAQDRRDATRSPAPRCTTRMEGPRPGPRPATHRAEYRTSRPRRPRSNGAEHDRARTRSEPRPALVPLTLYPSRPVRPGYQLGHGDRPDRLHRLQRLRRRLPGGEQHPGRRQGAGAARPRDALAPHRPLLSTATVDDPDDLLPAGAVHALRERAVRAGLPGRRHRPQRTRA